MKGGEVEDMNTRELERMLREKGAQCIEHGASHDKWMSRNGYQFTVPRHKTLPKGTIMRILKQADN